MTLRELINSVDSEQISKMQLLDAILKELSSDGFTASEASDFWSDFDRSASRRVTLA